MNEIYSPPPLRDLPAGRLGLRTAHLRAELETGGARRRKGLVLAAAALVLAATLLATPAFGLRDHFAHLISSGGPAHPPQLIQRMFQGMYDARPDEATGVMPRKARVAISLTIPGYGHKNLWVAPTRSGGYCSTLGCNRARSERFRVQLGVGGRTSAHAAGQGSRAQHVFVEGETTLRNARSIVIRYEGLRTERRRLVWIRKPIDAGFFLFEVPKSHWEPGRRPVAIAAYDSKGRALAEESIGGWFLELQADGYALPAKRFDRVWLFVPLAALLGLVAGLLWRRFATR